MQRAIKEICSLLAEEVPLTGKEIEELLESPPQPEMGDFAFPCFHLAPGMKMRPADIALDLAHKINSIDGRYWHKVENKGPYLNFFVDLNALGQEVIPELISKSYLSRWCSMGRGRVVVLDYSAPNIAKPFGVGHLRSTVIGNALYRIYRALGYKTVGINHLGDWGTQFGKLIAAYLLWGEEKELEKAPVEYSYRLYVDFHQKAKEDPSLEETGRQWFKRLEAGDQKALELWEKFCSYSLSEFKKTYAAMGIEFDYYHGESYYNRKLEEVIQLAQQKGIVRESEGALIVDLEKHGLPPCILRKKDGATLYITRDLAAAIYRYRRFRFSKMLYVVGAEQSLHFQQLFKILELMGFSWSNHCVHVPFGLIRFKDGRMSTREGNIVLLEEVIEKATALAYKIIEEKNPHLEKKEEVARQVGLGAIKFGDLYNDRVKDVEFEWDKVLDFSGETAPYVQYSHARLCSILRKARESLNYTGFTVENQEVVSLLKEEEERALLKQLSLMGDIIIKSQQLYKPSLLARYLVEVAREFNRFYHRCQVLGAGEGTREARLYLIEATRSVLKQGLSILGIDAPEEM